MFKKLYHGIAILLFSINVVHAGPISNLTAQAWLVADSSGNILDGSNISDVRSIASITKLMTVIVVLDSGQDLHEIIPRKLHNKSMTRHDLIDLAIVKSDNTAAKMLCDYYVSGYDKCIEAMNNKAQLLAMHDTRFIDPTGIYHDNISTAQDLVKLVMAASHYPEIVENSKKDVIVYKVGKKNKMSFYNTNSLVAQGYNFVVSKTGFINKAGGCIVFMMETVRGIRTVVLLGSRNTKTRIPEAQLIAASY